MKITLAMIVATALLSVTPTLAQMQPMHGMKMQPGEKMGSGSGVVTAIDPKTGTVTIKHGPIAAVNWPAMTMTFRAAPATLLKAAHVGEKVVFDMRMRGSVAEVTSIRAD